MPEHHRITFDDTTVERVAAALREGQCGHVDEHGEHGCTDSTEHFARCALTSLTSAPGWHIEYEAKHTDEHYEQLDEREALEVIDDVETASVTVRLVGPWREVERRG